MTVVVDSSFLVAFHGARDAHHRAAADGMVRLDRGEWGDALLPEYVFLEVVTVLAARAGRSIARDAGDALLRSTQLEFVPCSGYFLPAFEIFRRPGARALSFADAAILAVARDRGAAWIATFDSDFSGIEGVTVVPG